MHKLSRNRHSLALKTGVLILACILLVSGLQAAWQDRFAASCLVRSSLDLRGMTGPGETIMSDSYPYTFYLSQRRTVSTPLQESDFLPMAQKNSVRYVLAYKFEPFTPKYLDSLGLEKVKIYEQWGDREACVIYRYGD
jgi:hypothetical protein